MPGSSKLRSLALLSLVVVLIAVACATPTPTAVPPTATPVPPTATPVPPTPTPVPPTPVPSTRTITYYGDHTITVPYTIERVASGWNAQNSIIAMLGFGDKIVATTDIIKASPVFAQFVPSIKNAVVCSDGSTVNLEALVSANPQVAFIMQGGKGWEAAEAAGIPVAYLKANALQNIVDRTLITGEILGGDAYERAVKYEKYVKDNLARVAAVVAKIPENERVRVYHCLSGALSTSSRPSLNQDWMDAAGVINVAENWTLGSGSANATLEQVIGANPDIIVAMNRKDADAILADPAWQDIKAVKEGKVYTNPKGMFWWCRETTEEALQFQWLSKVAYPKYFEDVDIAATTRAFYKEYYGYDLSDADVELFLNPK